MWATATQLASVLQAQIQAPYRLACGPGPPLPFIPGSVASRWSSLLSVGCSLPVRSVEVVWGHTWRGRGGAGSAPGVAEAMGSGR